MRHVISSHTRRRHTLAMHSIRRLFTKANTPWHPGPWYRWSWSPNRARQRRTRPTKCCLNRRRHKEYWAARNRSCLHLPGQGLHRHPSWEGWEVTHWRQTRPRTTCPSHRGYGRTAPPEPVPTMHQSAKTTRLHRWPNVSAWHRRQTHRRCWACVPERPIQDSVSGRPVHTMTTIRHHHCHPRGHWTVRRSMPHAPETLRVTRGKWAATTCTSALPQTTPAVHGASVPAAVAKAESTMCGAVVSAPTATIRAAGVATATVAALTKVPPPPTTNPRRRRPSWPLWGGHGPTTARYQSDQSDGRRHPHPHPRHHHHHRRQCTTTLPCRPGTTVERRSIRAPTGWHHPTHCQAPSSQTLLRRRCRRPPCSCWCRLHRRAGLKAGRHPTTRMQTMTVCCPWYDACQTMRAEKDPTQVVATAAAAHQTTLVTALQSEGHCSRPLCRRRHCVCCRSLRGGQPRQPWSRPLWPEPRQ
eukprot:m.119016 g.119016  ORF g.119016 m.119016 type:complete len:470 (-) comp11004_c0_seq3:4557-5966(-)